MVTQPHARQVRWILQHHAREVRGTEPPLLLQPQGREKRVKEHYEKERKLYKLTVKYKFRAEEEG